MAPRLDQGVVAVGRGLGRLTFRCCRVGVSGVVHLLVKVFPRN